MSDDLLLENQFLPRLTLVNLLSTRLGDIWSVDLNQLPEQNWSAQ